MSNGGAQGVMKTQNPMMTRGPGIQAQTSFPPLMPNPNGQTTHQGFPPRGGPSTPGFPPMTGGTPPAQPGARAPNINQTAATGINNSIAGARREMNYQPGYISPQQSRTSTSYGQGYQAAGANGQGARADD